MNESRQHGGQVRTTVDPPRGLRQVAPRVLSLADCVIAAADGALDVAEHYVGLARALRFRGGTTVFRVEYGVRMVEVGEAPKAGQAIAEGPAPGARRRTAQSSMALLLKFPTGSIIA